MFGYYFKCKEIPFNLAPHMDKRFFVCVWLVHNKYTFLMFCSFFNK